MDKLLESGHLALPITARVGDNQCICSMHGLRPVM